MTERAFPSEVGVDSTEEDVIPPDVMDKAIAELSLYEWDNSRPLNEEIIYNIYSVLMVGLKSPGL